MQTIELTNILAGCKPVPVLITSTVLKYGRVYIRKFLAWVSVEGEFRVFILVPTYHELSHDNNFKVDVICQVNDNSGAYECIRCEKVQILKKIHPVLVTRKIPA